MRLLGNLYEDVKGVTKDYQKAFEWYQKADNAGSFTGTADLADMYYHGLGRPVDMKKAYELYEKSAKQGYSVAMYNFGLMNATGEKGIERDPQKGLYWLEKAAELGDVEAEMSVWYILWDIMELNVILKKL